MTRDTRCKAVGAKTLPASLLVRRGPFSLHDANNEHGNVTIEPSQLDAVSDYADTASKRFCNFLPIE